MDGGSGVLQGVFVGNFRHSLDPKRRLTIPSEWREQVGTPSQVYVLPGVSESCLCVFPARDMARRLERIRNMSIADAEGRQFLRTLASRSDFIAWDAQGRVRVKDELMEFAGITSDVVLVGAFELFEIWSPERWKQQQESSAVTSNLGAAARYVGF